MASVASDPDVLAARESIKELKAAYCYCIDRQDWDGLKELFTEDASLDYGEDLGSYEGHAGVEEFTAVLDDLLDITSHMLANPVLQVDGDTATGKWYVDAREAFSDGTVGITQAEYRDSYRRVDGEWKFAAKTVRIQFHIRLEDGEIKYVSPKTEDLLL